MRKEKENLTPESTPTKTMELWCWTRCIKTRRGWKMSNAIYITNVTFHECGICQQNVAWVQNENIKATLNGVNPKHNIIHEQIGQEPRLVDDMVDLIPNLSEEPTPSRHPHHERPNLWWTPRILMRDGPSLVGLPSHVRNPTHIGPK
jgi:hypothetical protein